MSSTSGRLLELLQLLQTRRYWAGAALAEALGISTRSLRRDVERLRELGHPVVSTPGVDGGYRLGSGTTVPPLILDDREALALAVGLYGLANQGSTELAEATADALAKVVGILPEALRRRVELLRQVADARGWRPPPAELSMEVLARLAQACRDGVRVRFAYRSRDGVASDRYAEPYRLVALTGRWYLVAFDIDREDWRTFRVDRARDVHGTRNPFDRRPLPAEDLSEFVEERIRSVRSSVRVEVRIDAAPDTVRSEVGTHVGVEALDERTARLTMTVESLDWAVAMLASLDHDFVVIEPPELARRIVAIGDRFARSAGG